MQCQHGHGVSARSSTADKLPKPIVPLGGCKWPAKSVSSCSCGPHRAITHLLQRPTQCFTATQSRDHLRPRLKGRGPSYTAAQSGKGSLGASTPTPPDSGQQLLSQTETDIITQRLVWLSAVFMVGSFMPDILSHAGAAASTAGAAPAWLVRPIIWTDWFKQAVLFDLLQRKRRFAVVRRPNCKNVICVRSTHTKQPSCGMLR